MTTSIITPRLVLRRWRESDREPFRRLNADPVAMEHFPQLHTPEESDASFERIQQHFAEKGFGFWAVEIPGVTAWAGFIGLSTPRFEAAFTPCIEIGWRMAPEFWGKGYATEGATAAMEFGFETLHLPEIVSYTSPWNLRSIRVMERLGMTRNPDEDFDHPMVPAGHRLVRHVLYRKRSPHSI
jgi:RimJ/RimL family protein N-acetyltransferase